MRPWRLLAGIEEGDLRIAHERAGALAIADLVNGGE
jgi:hypothetical protein